MNKFKLGKPWLYKKRWLIFPDTIFDNIENTDCNDTTDGICHNNISMDKCLDLASEQLSSAGYIIENPDKTICVNIDTQLHPYLNPIYRLRNKEMYPSLKNVNVQSYIDITVFPYPPDKTNSVFFQDVFNLKNVQTDLFLNRNSVFVKDDYVNMNILPSRNTMFKNQFYIPVEYDTPIIFNIPGTNLTLDNKLQWSSRLTSLEDTMLFFKINNTRPFESDSLPTVTYDSTVYITYQDIYIVEVDENNKLLLTYMTYDKAKELNKNILFKLIPQVQCYYCDKDCKTVELKDTDMDKYKSRYKGKMVFRNPYCGGGCDFYDETTTNIPNHPYIQPTSNRKLILILICVCLTVIYMYI